MFRRLGLPLLLLPDVRLWCLRPGGSCAHSLMAAARLSASFRARPNLARDNPVYHVLGLC
jgi:hypothetical protein